MNKNLYIVVGLVILVLIGGGAYMMMNKNTSSSPSGTVSEQKPVAGSTVKSLKDLLTSGVSQKCTFKDKNENIDMDGVTYVTAGKMRTDFNTTVNGKMMTTHMIVEGKTSYIWTENQNTGFKMSFDPQTTETKSNVTQQGSVDINKMIDYNCSSWRGDNTIFAPPASVKFTDYSSMMGPSSGVKITPEQVVNPGCSACDSLEGDSKTQCRTALKCS